MSPEDPIDVSVIVPFFDEEALIGRCAEALRAQTYPRARYEIIMVDNNSRDGSRAVVERFPDIQLLSQPRQGSYAARNLGVAASRGRILAFTDSDCEADPDWIASIVGAMADPSLMLCIGERRYASDGPMLDVLRAYESEKAAQLTYGYTNNLAVRREVFDELGPFHEVGRGADTLFFRRVRREYPLGTSFVYGMAVRHLEVATITQYLRKKYIYGRAQKKAHSVESDNGPGLERPDGYKRAYNLVYAIAIGVPHIARRIRDRNHYGTREVALLHAIGWADHASFFMGRLVAEITDREHRE